MSKKVKVGIVLLVVAILAVAGIIFAKKFMKKTEKDNGKLVYVQSVKDITGVYVGLHNRYMGIVESQEVKKVNKDSDKKIKEIKVKEGDSVKEGDPLFSYDTDDMELELQKKEIEDRKKGVAYSASFAAPAMDIVKLYNLASQVGGSVQFISARVDDVIVYGGVIFPVVVTAELSLANETQSNDGRIGSSAEKEGQCIISDILTDSTGIHIGESILIHGQEYTVGGISHSASRDRIIQIPYKEMHVLYPDYYIQQTIGGEREAIEAFITKANTFFPDLRVIEINNSVISADETEHFVIDMILTRSMVGIIAVIIGILNTVIVLISEMHTHISRYGIRRAYGAQYFDILQIILCDFIPAGVTAVIALFITFPKIMATAGLTNEIRFDIGGCVAISVFSIAFVVMLASLIARRINRTCIADLLEERV